MTLICEFDFAFVTSANVSYYFLIGFTNLKEVVNWYRAIKFTPNIKPDFACILLLIAKCNIIFIGDRRKAARKYILLCTRHYDTSEPLKNNSK